MTKATRKQLKCHGCGSADLILRETFHEHVEYDGGLFVNERGHLEAAGGGVRSPGDVQVQLTRIECASCGCEWRPRRRFDGGGKETQEDFERTQADELKGEGDD